MSQGDEEGEEISGSGNSKCKGPVVGMCSVCSRKAREPRTRKSEVSCCSTPVLLKVQKMRKLAPVRPPGAGKVVLPGLCNSWKAPGGRFSQEETSSLISHGPYFPARLKLVISRFTFSEWKLATVPSL